MSDNPIKSILNKLKNNEISTDEAEKLLLNNLSESIGSATIDHARSIFKEFPEVIFAENHRRCHGLWYETGAECGNASGLLHGRGGYRPINLDL